MTTSPLSVDARLRSVRHRRTRVASSITDAKVAWKSDVLRKKAKDKFLSKRRRRWHSAKLLKVDEESSEEEACAPYAAGDDWITVSKPMNVVGARRVYELYLQAKRWLLSLW